MKKTVFLDRDGVINKDSADYIKSWEEFEFLPGSLEAIKRLTDSRFDIIIITNQSVIKRGMVTDEGLRVIFSKMKTAVETKGGVIKDIFFCPHMPEDNCSCRKPRPGLILSAREKYGMDLSKAYMVGDSAKDIECAKRAGCGHSVLVRTGNGQEALKSLLKTKTCPFHVAENLLEAANWIITHYHSSYSTQ